MSDGSWKKKDSNTLIEAMPSIIGKTSACNSENCRRRPGKRANPQERILELDIGEHVEFMGAVANETLPEIYHSSDVVVFPSVVAGDGDREGFGLVLVEALGCECATVVTDLPAMRDIIHNGQSALVVPQKDSVQLAEKICRLLEDDTSSPNTREAGQGICFRKI